MKILKSPKDLAEALLRLDTVEASLKEEMFDGAVVASSNQENLMTKIDTIRRQIRQEADDVTVEAMQQLMTQLRNVVHTLTDLIYAKAARGENSKPLSKFQDMIATIVKSLALPGDDEQDSNRDGFKDDAELPLILDDDDSDDNSDLKKAINFATKQAKKVADVDDAEDNDEQEEPSNDSTEDEEPAPDEDEEPAKESSKKPPEDEDSADTQDDNEETNTTNENEDNEEPDGSGNADEDSDEGFMSNLLKQDAEEDEAKDKGKGKEKKAKGDEEVLDDAVDVTASMLSDTAGFVTTAGLRFLYYGIRNVRAAGGKPYKALKTAFGNTHTNNVTFYYYILNLDSESPLFGGSYEKVDKTFVKLLHSKNGYAALSSQINSLLRSGALSIAGRSKGSIAEAVNDNPVPYWAFTGIGPNPKLKTQSAIWLELGTQRYAIVPVNKDDYKDIGTISSLLKAILVGGKESGGSGTPYDVGYGLAEQLLKTGSIKGVKIKFKTIFVEKVK